MSAEFPANVHTISTACPAICPVRFHCKSCVVTGRHPSSIRTLPEMSSQQLRFSPRGVRGQSMPAPSPRSRPQFVRGRAQSAFVTWQRPRIGRELGQSTVANHPLPRTVHSRVQSVTTNRLRAAHVLATSASAVLSQTRTIQKTPLTPGSPPEPQFVRGNPKQSTRPITIVKPSVPRA